MRTKVLLSPMAKRDLEEIGDYISRSLANRSAAARMLRRLHSTVMELERFPMMGTPLTANKGYRYLICGNYMVFYYLSDGTAWVDRVLYGRRDYMSILFGNEWEDEKEPS